MRILVVEDERRIADTIKKGLEQERMIVDVAYDGEEGWDLAESGIYDVVVLDLMLPKMDGMAVCRKLREANIFTPILILTAKGQVEDKVTGLDGGADDYLTKPFSFEELVARIRALSRRPQAVEREIIKVADLVLNPPEHTVKRGNNNITLTGREFSLLEYLMRNPGRVVTREQIINHVWNFDSDVLPNTVEVYIRSLRNKIERKFKDRNPLIQTVRGFGYKIS